MENRTAAPLVTSDGAPIICQLSIRESSVQPGRLKVGLMIDPTNGLAIRHDGENHEMHIPSPIKKAMKAEGATSVLVDGEFRLEMN